MPPAEDVDVSALLDLLRAGRGFDFTGYKRSSVQRRVHRRIEQLGLESSAEYVDYLQVHAEEYTTLLNALLINVTAFFRDPPAWERLRTDVLPDLAAAGTTRPIRLWSAGCASGEEAYSLVMLLADMLGEEEVRDRAKVYATDIDEDALVTARAATYPASALAQCPAAYVERYFEPADGGFTFRRDLRRCVIFGRHDLLRDAPISRIDLLACRNTLMYLNAETQARVLRRLHFGLADGGVLFLGRAETLLTRDRLFVPIDLRFRLFRKTVGRPAAAGSYGFGPDERAAAADPVRLQEAALLSGPVAQLVVGTEGELAVVNHAAGALFGLGARDVGRLFSDLEVSYRPVELRSLLDRVLAERQTVAVPDVQFTPAGSPPVVLEVRLMPLLGDRGVLTGVSISFDDVTRHRRLQDEVEAANALLASASAQLQVTNEELATANEELQSTNEELETTNEELQSVIEELRTMNEELQSTHGEHAMLHAELRNRTAEAGVLQESLLSLLTGVGAGLVILDQAWRVRVWSRFAETRWGIRREDAVGVPLLALPGRLPVAQLRPLVAAAFGGARFDGLVAQSSDEEPLRLTAAPLRNAQESVTAVLLLCEPVGEESR